MPHVKLTPDVIDVLTRSKVGPDQNLLGGGAWSLTLPGQLARPLYVAVNKALLAAGGKWNKSAGAHVFDGDPRERLGIALESGMVIDQKVVRQAFYTPPEVADEMATLALLRPGLTVLEPSAGGGALADACLKFEPKVTVFCIEKDSGAAAKLSARGLPARCADFLTWDGGFGPWGAFDRVVMNPPFSRGADAKHVAKAYEWLAPGGRLVALMLKESEDLAARGARVLKSYPRGTFRKSGTEVETLLVIWDKP